MTKLIVAVAIATVATLAAAPALADPTAVIVDGKVVGKDPDANIRFQLRRDAGSEGY